ncbi:hypothetical protein FRUB_00977 [Fimbriiglobus ruber]|uniref:Uncharacterized protein n=1 Tax=Fimbriiglobus ruber TaxID=1908690 RepID=A0A225E945_9BACT|nr:hypothetical protein FRUB_00977 [Fimbriiglobus ruber]
MFGGPKVSGSVSSQRAIKRFRSGQSASPRRRTKTPSDFPTTDLIVE